MKESIEIPFRELSFGSVISSGSRGAVFRGQWVPRGLEVAIKRLDVGLGKIPAALAPRVLLSGHIELARLAAAALKCRSACKILGFSTDGLYLHIVMPYLTGGSLGDAMERAGGALSPSTFLKTAVELLSGLCELHEAGIVHCGVKPENAVLDESGCVILSGFGVDRLITQSMGSRLMTPANTALTLSDGGRYLAPEQWDQDDLEPTPATDAWGAAATLCHLASGTPPFLGLDPWEICRCVCELERPPPVPDEIPEPLLSVVRRAFAIDPTHRATVAELLSAAQSARAAANAGLMERCSAHGGDVPVLSVVPCGDPVPPLARHHVCAKCLGDMVGRARDKLSKMMLSRGGLLACPGGAGTCPGGIHPRRAVQCLVGSGRHEAGDVVCMASRQARLAAEDPEEVRAEELRSQLQGLVGAGREWFDSQVAKHKAAAIALVSDSCSRCQKPMVLPGEGDPMLLRCGSPRCTDGRHSLACGWCLRDCRDDVARALVHVRDCQRNPRKGVPAAPSVREVKQASHSRARARLARYLATNVPDVLVEEVVEALEGTLKALHISGADMLMRVYGQVASKTDAPGWGDVEAVKGMLTTMDGAVDVEDLEGAVHMLGAAHRARGNELGRDDLSCRGLVLLAVAFCMHFPEPEALLPLMRVSHMPLYAYGVCTPCHVIGRASPDPCICVAWSADDGLLAIGEASGAVSVRDSFTGAELERFVLGPETCRCVDWHPGGLSLAVDGPDNSVQILSIGGTARPFALQGHHARISSVKWSPDGTGLASGSEDCSILLWDVSQRARILSMSAADPIWAISWSPDGRRLVSGDSTGAGAVWDVKTGRRMLSIKEMHNGKVGGVVWGDNGGTNPTGKFFVTGGDDGLAKKWDSTTGGLLAVMQGHVGPITSVQWMSEGKHVVTSSLDKTACIWVAEPQSNKLLWRLEGHSRAIRGGACAADQPRIATASDDGTVRLWHPFSDTPQASAAPQRRSNAGASSPPKRRSSSGGSAMASPGVRRFSLTGGATLGPSTKRLSTSGGALPSSRRITISGAGRPSTSGLDLPLSPTFPAAGQGAKRSKGRAVTTDGHESAVRCVAWAPDKHRLATAADDRRILLWDMRTGAESGSLDGHRGSVRAVAFGPEGVRMASASADGTVRVWDIKTGLSQLELEMPGHAWGLCVAWSPDGSLIAAGSRGGSSRVWTSIAGHVVADLDGHTGAVCTMAWAPSGRRLLTGAEDGQIRVWDPESGSNTGVFAHHTLPIRAVAFAPDARLIASTGDDGTVVLCSYEDEEKLEQAQKIGSVILPSPGKDLAWAPDGADIAVACGDGILRVCAVMDGTVEVELRGHMGAVLGCSWAGKHVATGGRDHTARVWDAWRARDAKKIYRVHPGTRSISWSNDASEVLQMDAGGAVVARFDINTGVDPTIRTDTPEGSLGSSPVPGNTPGSASGSRLGSRAGSRAGSRKGLMEVPKRDAEWRGTGSAKEEGSPVGGRQRTLWGTRRGISELLDEAAGRDDSRKGTGSPTGQRRGREASVANSASGSRRAGEKDAAVAPGGRHLPLFFMEGVPLDPACVMVFGPRCSILPG